MQKLHNYKQRKANLNSIATIKNISIFSSFIDLKSKKQRNKNNYNAVIAVTNAIIAIAAISAIIVSIVFSVRQLNLNRTFFQEQTDCLIDQLELLSDEKEIMLNQFDKTESYNRLNMDLTKEAINHDDMNKAKIIPKIIFMDLLEKHWNLRLVIAMQKEQDNSERLSYIFGAKLNTLLYTSINNYDLFLAFTDYPYLAYEITTTYNNIERIYEEYMTGFFNQESDTIEVTGSRFPLVLPFVLSGETSFNDFSIVERTLIDIKNVVTSINENFNYFDLDRLNAELKKEVSDKDIQFYN